MSLIFGDAFSIVSVYETIVVHCGETGTHFMSDFSDAGVQLTRIGRAPMRTILINRIEVKKENICIGVYEVSLIYKEQQ